MNKEALRKKRARAEWRFRFYGIAGLTLATFALLALLGIIVSKGLPGLIRTELRLTVHYGVDAGPENASSWRTMLQASLMQRFSIADEDRLGKRKLMQLLSNGAERELKTYAEEFPQIVGKRVHVWLTASDLADRYTKTGDVSRFDEQQIAWLKALKASGELRTSFNTGFFTGGDSRQPEQAGFASSMMGSLLTLAVCLLVAFPLGVLSAVYLEEFAPKNTLVDFVEVNINNLAAIPSIVFGLLGLAIYLNLFGLPRSAPLVGGMTLALMILPTIIIATRVAIQAVPDSIRNAARALGASPVQVVFHHVVPLAVPGIMTGTILGLARAIGETAPLLLIGMVAFVADIPRSFTDPASVMPVQIYLWASSPELSFVEKTAAGIMVLLIILLMMNAAAIVIRKRFERRW